MLTDMAFLPLTFFQMPSWRLKLLQSGYYNVKVSEKGNIKVIEVKGQGYSHFAILLVRKVHFLQCMTNLSQIDVNWSEKSIYLLT